MWHPKQLGPHSGKGCGTAASLGCKRIIINEVLLCDTSYKPKYGYVAVSFVFCIFSKRKDAYSLYKGCRAQEPCLVFVAYPGWVYAHLSFMSYRLS